MRIMIDTNVLLSAVVFPNPKMTGLIEKVTTGHSLVLCSHIIEEIHDVINRKFQDKKDFLEKFLSKLTYDFVYTPTDINPKNYPEIRDKDDLPILVSALTESVDLIITGDEDFFDIKAASVELPIIMTPRKFMEEFM
ncbi:MAG: putative toxin-antitoxin system toxin component, PIN family [Firmicutes bacterium]|mgnify:CR=1 FL=1|nr:putative toxin-antitoxin system toxin component, PIN family [Bacillota bacterium]